MSQNEVVLGKNYTLLFQAYSVTGFWRIESETRWKKLAYWVYARIMRLWLGTWVIFLCIDAYMNRKNLKVLINNLCPTVICILNAIKVTIFTIKMDKVVSVKEDMANHLNLPFIGQSEEDRDILYKAERQMHRMGRMLWTSATILSCSWILAPIANANDQIFPLPFPRLFDIEESPAYECIYAYHVFTYFITTLVIIAYDLIFCSFLNQICAHFNILMKNLNEITKLYPEIDFSKLVDGCKEYHEFEDVTNAADLEINMKHSAIKDRTYQTMKMMKNTIRHHQAIIR